jgi:hypothetical protein
VIKWLINDAKHTNFLYPVVHLPKLLLLFFAVVCFQKCSRGLRRLLDQKITKNLPVRPTLISFVLKSAEQLRVKSTKTMVAMCVGKGIAIVAEGGVERSAG